MNEQLSDTNDLDDVEGHGLREVAVGIGAAAILAGGATAASAGGSHVGRTTVHPSGATSASQAHVPGGGVGASSKKADLATALLRDVANEKARVEHLADPIIHPPTVKPTSTVPPYASPVDGVERKAATVLSLVSSAEGNGVHTAKALLTPVKGGPHTDAGQAGGWLLVKSGDAVLAQVHVKLGEAVVSWTMPAHGDRVVTVTYTGDEQFAPSTRTLQL